MLEYDHNMNYQELWIKHFKAVEKKSYIWSKDIKIKTVLLNLLVERMSNGQETQSLRADFGQSICHTYTVPWLRILGWLK